MLEREVKRYLYSRVKAAGGEVRKVRWEGRRGAPDQRVMLPSGCFWAELKRPGKKPTAAQAREHKRMRQYGERVEVIDAKDVVDRLVG